MFDSKMRRESSDGCFPPHAPLCSKIICPNFWLFLLVLVCSDVSMERRVLSDGYTETDKGI